MEKTQKNEKPIKRQTFKTQKFDNGQSQRVKTVKNIKLENFENGKI